jgi:uncharacterized membrane protein
METPRRAIAKALSYRVFGCLATASVAWALTGQARLAASVGALDFVVKLVFYYAHERAWNRLSYGRAAVLSRGGKQ